MRVGVTREMEPGEKRVALAPSSLAILLKGKHAVLVEPGAGEESGYSDQEYRDAGAEIAAGREEVFSSSDVVAQVRSLGSASATWQQDMRRLRPGQWVVGCMDPLGEPAAFRTAAESGAATFALELLPRITRAQSMDVLSSQANLGGYKAVILAAAELPKIFPMMMTAAGTITPARVFVVGAGVAGLQAIATAKRLGAVVSAYDVRPAVKEQVESVGARFLEIPMTTEEAAGAGGYARAMGEDFYRRQAELMKPAVAESDIVVTTAAIPGQKAPVLVSREMVEAMRPGSVIVDLAAERGGNCELTRAGERIVHRGVLILGPLNLPSSVAGHASQLYGRNVANFIAYLGTKVAEDGPASLDRSDEIVRETLVTWQGEVVHPRVRQQLGLPEPEPAGPAA